MLSEKTGLSLLWDPDCVFLGHSSRFRRLVHCFGEEPLPDVLSVWPFQPVSWHLAHLVPHLVPGIRIFSYRKLHEIMAHMFCRSAHSTSEAQVTCEVDEEQLDIPEEQHEETHAPRVEDSEYTGEHNFCGICWVLLANEDWVECSIGWSIVLLSA